MSPALNISDSPASNGGAPRRTLLLAPPSIATHEEKLRGLFTTFDRPTTDLQMLDRLAAGVISLPANTYDSVWVLTDADGSHRSEALKHLTRDVYSRLVPSMKVGGRLQTQDGYFGPSETKEAVLAGLVQNDGSFEKMDDEEEVVIPLRLGAKKKGAPAVAPPPKTVITLDANDLLDDGDDDLIDEDALLTEEDLKRPLPQPPPECQPKVGRRRRACKDCTCGLAERLEAEDTERRANADKSLKAFKLDSDDLNELDFTVQGKTGSCGNCALGDAFRCAGCPFIGLPAFQPGQEVQILNDIAQL